MVLEAEVTDVFTCGLTEAVEVIGECQGLALEPLSLVALLPVEVCGENKGLEKLDETEAAGLAIEGEAVANLASSVAFLEEIWLFW